MSSIRFQKIRLIFHAALQRPPEERAPLLDEVCGDDKELREEVERLLGTERMSGSFLEHPVLTRRDNGLSNEQPQGLCIGQYRLVRMISIGGMGAVYEATQEHLSRTVAVKVMKKGIASPALQRRFEYEARILARLQHPNIAQVIDAGTCNEEGQTITDDEVGLPYFVMEFIDGAMPLTDYARAKAMSLRERLALFRDACEAVHYGHQKGIIHRDLKPSNILVDAEGRLKVIDFGVARATDSDLALTTIRTEVGQLIGTLQYMSPEQCEADPGNLDIRSDVYALGVVLYELLCEVLPYDVREAALIEAVRLIRETQPKKPSTIRRILGGDVETIVLKTLEKEPGLRYQSVAELGADIERYLTGRVILAKSAGPVTRIRKLARRNPVRSVATVTVLGCAVAFALYVIFWSYPRLQEEQVKLEAEMTNSVLVKDFLEEMFSWVDPKVEGRGITLKEILDRAVERLEGETQPRTEIEASLRGTIGETYVTSGDYETAERELKKSIALYRSLPNDSKPELYVMIGRLANLYGLLGRFDEAEPLYLEALDGSCRLRGKDHPDALAILSNLARQYMKTDRYDECERCLLEAIEGMERVLDPDHPDVLETRNNLSTLYTSLGRFDDAEPIIVKVLSARRRVLGDDHLDTIHSMYELACLYMYQLRFEKAEPLLLEVREVHERILDPEDPDRLNTMNALANLYMDTRRPAEAERLFEELIETQRRVFGDRRLETIIGTRNYIILLRDQGRLEEALPLASELLESARGALGEKHHTTLGAMGTLATIYRMLGRLEEAEALQVETLEGLRGALGNGHWRTLNCQIQLGTVYAAQDRLAEAELVFQDALDSCHRALGEDHFAYHGALQELGRLYTRQQRYDDAEPLLTACLERRCQIRGRTHARTLDTQELLVDLYICQDRFEEALPLSTELVEATSLDSRRYALRAKQLDRIRYGVR